MNIGERTVATSATRESGRRRRAILWFCSAFIFVQLAVPVYQLTLPPNQPFGWQMYSSITGYVFEVVSEDGTSRIIDPADYVLRYRSEIDYRDHLPKVLCREHPKATQIVMSVWGTESTESYPCER